MARAVGLRLLVKLTMTPWSAEINKPVVNRSTSTILHNLVRTSPTERCGTESNHPPHPWRWIPRHRAMESGNGLQVTREAARLEALIMT
jgi:hypothetical protein